MKKIVVPLKEEECFIKELKTEEIETLDAGGKFPFAFWNRCVGFKTFFEINTKSINCKKYKALA